MNTLLALLLSAGLSTSASAQELDASGLESAPDSHDPRDAPWSWSPGDDRSGQGAFQLVGSYASQTAVRTDSDGKDEQSVVLLDQLVGAGLGDRSG